MATMAWSHQHISASVAGPFPVRGEGGSLALSLGVGGLSSFSASCGSLL